MTVHERFFSLGAPISSPVPPITVSPRASICSRASSLVVAKEEALSRKLDDAVRMASI
jgi:hypothetical protein